MGCRCHHNYVCKTQWLVRNNESAIAQNALAVLCTPLSKARWRLKTTYAAELLELLEALLHFVLFVRRYCRTSLLQLRPENRLFAKKQLSSSPSRSLASETTRLLLAVFSFSEECLQKGQQILVNQNEKLHGLGTAQHHQNKNTPSLRAASVQKTSFGMSLWNLGVPRGQALRLHSKTRQSSLESFWGQRSSRLSLLALPKRRCVFDHPFRKNQQSPRSGANLLPRRPNFWLLSIVSSSCLVNRSQGVDKFLADLLVAQWLKRFPKHHFGWS